MKKYVIPILSRIIILVMLFLFTVIIYETFTAINTAFRHWDAYYQVEIAIRGYGDKLNVLWAFYPLFPIIVRGMYYLTRDITATIIITVTINSIFFIIGMVLLYKIVEMLRGKVNIFSYTIAVFLPSSIFCSLIYAESIFFLLATLFLYLLIKRRYFLASLTGALVGLARPTSLFLVAYIVYLDERLSRKMLYIFIIILGFLSFNIYGYFRLGIFPATEIARRTFWPYAHINFFRVFLWYIDALFKDSFMVFLRFPWRIVTEYDLYWAIRALYFFPFIFLIISYCLWQMFRDLSVKDLFKFRKDPHECLKIGTIVFMLLHFCLWGYGIPYSFHRYILVPLIFLIVFSTFNKRLFLPIMYLESVFLLAFAWMYVHPYHWTTFIG